MKTVSFTYLLIFLLTAYSSTQLQAFDNAGLDRIKSEIKSLQKKYKRDLQREKDELSKLEVIDKTIFNSQMIQKELDRKKSELENEIDRNQEIIQNLKHKINENSSKQIEYALAVNEIKDNLAKRYATLYKKKRNKGSFLADIDFKNINKSFVKKKYFEKLKYFDKKNIINFLKLKDELAELEISLENNTLSKEVAVAKLKEKVKMQRNLLRLQKREMKSLAGKKKDKKKIISKINSNLNLYQKSIAEKEKAAKELKRFIVEMERKRIEEKRARKKMANKKSVKSYFDDVKFSKIKKKLIWPVEGKIVSFFGSHRNSKTKTLTFNPGIEIKTKKESNVKAVSKGEIIKITWLRGYGNTMIMNHGEGFYTVYSNLDKIFKDEGEKIETGDALAMVGDDGKNGKLHFEIWHKKKKLNPSQWLKRQ